MLDERVGCLQRSLVIGLSVCIIVALFVRISVTGANKVEGTMSCCLGINEILTSNMTFTRLKVKQGHFETATTKGALENEDRSTKDPKLENEAPKTRNLSAFIKHETVPCQVTNANRAGIKRDLTNRMQFKTIQVELRGAANAILPP